MGSIKLIFGLFVIVVAIYLGVELVPAYYTNYEFQDDINNEALMAPTAAKPKMQIQESVFKQAQQAGIPNLPATTSKCNALEHSTAAR